MNARAVSVERLIHTAFAYGLLHDYRMTPDRIELSHASGTTSLDPEEARVYLQGLVRGYEAALLRQSWQSCWTA